MRKSNMITQEIVDYIAIDMKKTVVDDIKPCLLIGVREGGYFSVPRLVLSCVDYLGALYCGWKPTETYAGGKPNFTATRKAVRYLKDVFGQVFSDYKVRAELLWEMYRHGTVHLNEPKVLQNGTKSISWQIFKAGFNERMIIGGVPTGPGTSVQMYLSHLVPMEITGLPGQWILPIGTTCLYEDLVASLDVYAGMVLKDRSLEDNFRSAVNEMVKPEEVTIAWP